MPKPKPVPRPPPAPRTLVAWGNLQRGLKEEAFYLRHGLNRVPNLHRKRLSMVRKVYSVNYRSTSGNWPGFSVRDRFAVRWSGFLIISGAGSYRFSLRSDDGSKMYIDNRFMLNNDGLHGMRYGYSTRTLGKGQFRVRIEFFENGGGAGCEFRYRGADTRNRDQIVSGNALRHVPATGFKEEVHYNLGGLRSVPNLNRKPSMVRIVPQVVYGNTNRNWPGFAASQNFAVRWTGSLKINRGGRYRWNLGSDDGSRLYLNNRYVLNNDGLHGFRWRSVDRRVSGNVRLKVEFFERGGHAGMLFRYMGSDTGNRMIYVRKNMKVAF